MFRWFALFCRIWSRAGAWLLTARGQTASVLLLLVTHVALLAYSATRHSPTHLEPAFLSAGISHWQFGRFELYRVNPPLPRMIAALSVLAVGCETDWQRFYDRPGSRAEFAVGEDFVRTNGSRAIPLFFYARWACIPFSLIGGWFAYRWANELYGNGAGLLTLVLWTFEPNLLAHAELVTPDCACWSFGIMAGYTYWRWLKVPTWTRAGLAGLALGLAELTKFTWVILFGLWPILWLTWLWLRKQSSQDLVPMSAEYLGDGAAQRLTTGNQSPLRLPGEATRDPAFRQLAAILLLALYILNLGYGFDGIGTRLKDLTFVSSALTGLDEKGESGNRFRDNWLGQLQLPVPEQYILGFDTQKKDLEDYARSSFLRGEWKDGGWWHYYFYGLLVKVPCGLWLLFTSLILFRLLQRTRPVPLRDELVLLSPAVAVFALCTTQTEINEHLRYVFPSLALMLVWLGQGTVLNMRPAVASEESSESHGILFSPKSLIAQLGVACSIVYSTVSVTLVYPHHLAYFNDFVGGSRNGWKHLHGSSLHWGQDLLEVARHEAAVGTFFCRYRANASAHVTLDTARQYCNPDGHRRRDCSGVVVAADSRDFGLALKSSGVVRIGMTHAAVPELDFDIRCDLPGAATPFRCAAFSRVESVNGPLPRLNCPFRKVSLGLSQ